MLIWYKLGAAALIIGALWGYWAWSNAKIETLIKANTKLELKISTQTAEIQAADDQRIKQDEAITTLMVKTRENQMESDRYLSIIKRHNLHALADARPGMMEKRVNSGTKKVLRETMNETAINPTN